MTGDAAADRYLGELTTRLRALLGDRLVGAYLSGSGAMGAYEAGRSDLDVFVVAARPLERDAKERLVAALRHEALPCPAKGLELVVYTAAEAASPSDPPELELNLNTGARTGFRAAFDNSEDAPHWFVLDLVAVRRYGVPLAGPPPQEVFGELPRRQVATAIAALLDWQEREEPATPNTVLNALRALRYVETGELGSKAAAAEWAGTELARTALAARREGGRVDADLARELVEQVRARVRA